MTKYIITVEANDYGSLGGMVDKYTLLYEVTCFDAKRALVMHNALTGLWPHCIITTTLKMSRSQTVLEYKGKL